MELENNHEKNLDVFIISVGASKYKDKYKIGPGLKQVVEYSKSKNPLIYIIYGKDKGEKNEYSSESIAGRIEKRFIENGVEENRIRKYPVEPQDFNEAFSEMLKIVIEIKDYLLKILDKDNVNITVDFTGGTKLMSSLLFFLTDKLFSSHFKIKYNYVTSDKRDEYGKAEGTEPEDFKIYAFKDSKLKIIEIIENLSEFNYKKVLQDFDEIDIERAENEDKEILRTLKFISESYHRLDMMDYENIQIKKFVDRMHLISYVKFVDKEKIDKIISDINKLMTLKEMKIDKVLAELKRLSDKNIKNPDEIEIDESFIFVPLEIFCNSLRRLKEKDYVFSVIRAYRSIESAVQIKLLENKINPWVFNFDQVKDYYKDEDEFKEDINVMEIPDKISLNQGFIILKRIIKNISDEDEKILKSIQKIRNFSNIAHGYDPIDQEKSNYIIDSTEKLLAKILFNGNLEEMKKTLSKICIGVDDYV